MSTLKSLTPIAAVLARSMGSISAQAADSTTNSSVSTVATPPNMKASNKAHEGKCGEAKCGAASSKTTSNKAHEGKCGEAKCGAASSKTTSSKTTSSKAHEGKCGEAKCGGHKKAAQ